VCEKRSIKIVFNSSINKQEVSNSSTYNLMMYIIKNNRSIYLSISRKFPIAQLKIEPRENGKIQK
jgi:hypothetical protein